MLSPFRSLLRPLLFALGLCAAATNIWASGGSGWALTKIAQTGESGFTSITYATAAADGKVAVLGVKDGATGIYLVGGGAVTTVVTQGATLNATLGKVETLGDAFHIDAQGRVLFNAWVSGGTLPEVARQRCFRWDAGAYTRMVPDVSDATHLLKHAAPDGRWIVEKVTRVGESRTYEYFLTDGVTSTLVWTLAVGSVSFDSDHIVDALPSGLGSIAVVRSRKTETKDEFGFVVSVQQITDLLQVGSTSRTLATETRNWAESEPQSGILISSGSEIAAFTGSSSGAEVAYLKKTYIGGKSGGSEIVLVGDSGPRTLTTYSLSEKGVLPEAVDSEGRVILNYVDSSVSALLGGLDPVADKIVAVGDSLFGGSVAFFTFYHAPETAGTFGDRRSFVFKYRLSDTARSEGVCLATRNVARWTLASGGSWDTASAWSTQTVPTSTTEVLFDLESTYDVRVGTASIGRASVENGSVAWRQPALSVTAGITLGADGSLTQSEGTITAGELTVGSLPPLNLSDASVARLRISNTGTALTTSGEALIGRAGRGEMTVSGATVSHASARIGSGAEGSVIVGAAGAEWTVPSLAVGDTRKGSLTIENGGFVRTTETVIGRGDAKSTEVGSLIIDNAHGASPAQGFGNWFNQGNVTVGANLVGFLSLERGGVAAVTGDLKMATVSQPDEISARVIVRGEGTTADRRSVLYLFGKTELSLAAQTTSIVAVLNGGSLAPVLDFSVAAASGGSALVEVEGVNANGIPSELDMGPSGRLKVGDFGSGWLQVTDGGLVSVANLDVGVNLGASGDVFVSGGSARASLLRCSNLLSVGGLPAVGSGASATGVLDVKSPASVEAKFLSINPRGRLMGNGVVTATDIVVEGIVEPGAGVKVDPNLVFQPLRGLAQTSRAKGVSGVHGMKLPAGATDAVETPAVLTLRGNITFKTGSRLELTVAGPGAADHLQVDGALALGGTLALYFVDGYAPAKGDTFDLISGVTQTGAFEILETAGLADGFAYTVSAAPGGGARITATSDGVPATAPRILTQPQAVNGVLGRAATLAVSATGTGLTYQWRRNGVELTGATQAVLKLSDLTEAKAGTYDVVVSNAGGAVTSASAALTVVDKNVGQLYNLSVRTGLGDGQNLIVGFVVAGGSKSLLLRAVGPGLAPFLSGAHADPSVTLFDGAGAVVTSNNDWEAGLSSVMTAVGAFGLPEGSKDAALVGAISGLRTAHTNGPGSGVVLVELYDTEAPGAARLVNVSARNPVGTGGNLLIAGFAIRGEGPVQVLVRGAGPALTAFGVGGALADPEITLFDSGGTALASNDDWSPTLLAAFAQVGAFGFPAGSADAALAVTLAPGVYTVHLKGKNDGTGEGLIEVYELD